VQAAIQLAPANAKYRHSLGVVHEAAEQWSSAADAFERAVEKRPNDVKVTQTWHILLTLQAVTASAVYRQRLSGHSLLNGPVLCWLVLDVRSTPVPRSRHTAEADSAKVMPCCLGGVSAGRCWYSSTVEPSSLVSHQQQPGPTELMCVCVCVPAVPHAFGPCAQISWPARPLSRRV
jgi:hypothetical protein